MMAGTERLDFVLRRAERTDAYALWLWANDPETRRASSGRATIPWAEHQSWLSDRLPDQSALVLIAVTPDGQPVGSIRFDTADAWATARLSYVVAPEARGRGLSRPLVAKGTALLRQERPGVEVRAEVLDDNARSLAVFRDAGWVEAATPGGHSLFLLKRRERNA